MTKDRVTAMISILTGILVAGLASRLPKSVMANDVGPAIFPYITSGIFIVCGICLFIKGGKPAAAPFLTGKQWRRFVEILAIEALYIAGMYLFGFVVPSILALFLVSVRFAAGSGKKIAIWHFGVFALAFTAALYLLFTYCLKMRLPVGILL